MSVYTQLGVKQVINAWGPMTIIGSALVRREVVQAMAEAAEWHVDVIDLQQAAGRRLAGLIGVEACYVAGGCAAGLAIATAAIMTGGDQANVASLPDAGGMCSEVVMQRSHRNPYDHAFTQVGAQIVEIGHGWQSFDWELEAAIGPQTAAVIYVYTRRTMNLSLSLAETVEIAHAHDVPVIVDAAAEVPPAPNLRGLKDTGADVVVISGGKGLRGPQNSALVLCSESLAESCIPHAAPMHSHGRSMKTTKEDIIGLLKAVEIYTGLDHDEITRCWQQEAGSVIAAVEGTDGIRATVAEAGYSDGIPVAELQIDSQRLGRSAEDVVAHLAAGDPIIRVGHDRDSITINPQFLQTGEMEMVISRLHQALSA
ncbi:MAG TPA: aminotransferase class V-fold PLP-dependent enzyme [Candidatus Latescibacteria bacterium]|jgi:L-seryl-tRNA(Ser) seleniumtransferase|nr:aminotransferase class V-fold PLP-dependent enzyme [Candidatus Latescibacterota bacterium]HJP33985.1 aminotransferase class V-fold PLP-dependent enzyme [Candidatus Latescibacterota bacterium]